MLGIGNIGKLGILKKRNQNALIADLISNAPIYQSGSYYFDDRTTYGNDLQLKNVAVLYLALADYMNSSIIPAATDIVRCYAKITNVGSNSLNGINESNNRFYFGVLSGKWGAGIGTTAVISTTTADTNWHLFEFNGTTKTFKVDGTIMCTMTGTFTPGTNPFYFGSTSGTAINSVIYMAWAEILDTNGNKKAFWGFKENYGTMAIDLSGNGQDGTIVSSDIVTARGSRLDNAEDFNIKLGYTLFQQIADPTRYIKATYTLAGLPTKTTISGYNKIIEVPANVISKITSTTFTGLPITEFNTAKGYDDFVMMASKLISIVKNEYYISRIKIKKDGNETTPYTLAVNNASSLLGYIAGNGQGITKSEANLAFWDFAFNSDSNVRTLEINYSLTGVNGITFRDMSTDTVIGALRVDFNEDYPSIHAIYNDSNIIGFPQILGYALIKPNEFKRLTSGNYYATLNNSLTRYNKFITKNIIPELLIATLGDSLTALGSGYGNYLKTPKTTVACHGIGGETPLQICGRYGLIPFLTRAEFTIPAGTTAVSVPIKSSWNGSTITGVGVYGMQTGSIAGIAGSFSKSGDLLMFTRTTAGAATVVPVDTEIKTYAGENYLNKIVILWMGQNGGFSSADDLVNMFKACAAKITSGKYIFISPPLNTSDELEAKMLTEFGDKYINIRQWCYTTGLSDCGITNPTTEDVAAQAAHLVPPSLRVDYVHFKEAARAYQGGTMIPNKIKSLNYI